MRTPLPSDALFPDPFTDVNAALGGAMSLTSGKPASLYSINNELAALDAYKAARGKLGPVPQKTLNREERIQQAIDANPQVSREDISLSDSDKNQTLMRLGLSMLAGGGRDFSETLGKSGLVAQDYAQQRKDLTLAEKKEQRAERLRQADALLRAAGEDTSEYNQQEILKRANELQRLGADFETARAGATMKEGANRNAIANAELERQRATAAASAKLADPRFRTQVLKNIAAVEANPEKYSRESQLQAQYWKSLLGIPTEKPNRLSLGDVATFVKDNERLSLEQQLKLLEYPDAVIKEIVKLAPQE